MKKILPWILCILAAIVLIICFWDPIIDFLPIDQSGWRIREEQHFYLNEDGDPLTGWQDIDGCRYYFDPESGVMHAGWLELGGMRYHLSPSGAMTQGWLEADDGRYYLMADGAMATGWLEDAGSRYHLDETGHPLTGWQDIGGARYFFRENGVMHIGWLEDDDGRYFLSEDGTMHTGWLEDAGARYYFLEDGTLHAGWLGTDEGRYFLTEEGPAHTGWLENDGQRFFFQGNGAMHTGWLDTDDGRFFLSEDGTMHTGWLDWDGRSFYLKEDGTAAAGRLVIDDQTYYFSSKGEHILMVNRWNSIPEGYQPDLKESEFGCVMDAKCIDALDRMLQDLKAACGAIGALNGYRTHGTQSRMFYGNIQELVDSGLSPSYAYSLTATSVAVPGTSEHQLGYAVDILDPFNPYYQNGEPQSVLWLKEHCWEYGFILRYPDEKTHITGIIYEPWHYRYVGVELAMEIRDSGLCLEEYLDQLTGDGTTCGNPDALKTE